MIELKIEELEPQAVSHIMTSLVVPRPIAWVSTVSGGGVSNLAPHSYFTAVSSEPPIVMFASTRPARGSKDTLRNIEEIGDFVVNLVSEDQLEPMNVTSAEVGPEVDEFELAGLTKAQSRMVQSPRLGEARASMECRVVRLLPMGDATAIFGEVVYVHIAQTIWRDGRVNAELLRPLSRLGGALYGTLGQTVRKPRPSRVS